MKKLGFILLVDDESICNFLTLRLLERVHAADTIKVASNGDEAIRIMRQYQKVHKGCPDLIILDINMPFMNGIEFMKVISNYAHRDKCRVVVLTTSNHPQDLEAIQKYGVSEIYTKPLTEQNLSEILQKVDEQTSEVVNCDDGSV